MHLADLQEHLRCADPRREFTLHTDDVRLPGAWGNPDEYAYRRWCDNLRGAALRHKPRREGAVCLCPCATADAFQSKWRVFRSVTRFNDGFARDYGCTCATP